MKIGGQSYVDVGEGVVKERIVTHEAPPPQPIREVVTLVAPVDTQHFDDSSAATASELKAMNERLARMELAISRQSSSFMDFAKAVADTENAITKNWLFRLVVWLGRIF